jgi:hypothetical protein
MRKWTNIEIGNLEQIITIVQKIMDATAMAGIKNLHFPSHKACFRSHPDTFCCIAEKMIKNDKLWEKLKLTHYKKEARIWRKELRRLLKLSR